MLAMLIRCQNRKTMEVSYHSRSLKVLGGKRNIDGVVIGGWWELKHPCGHKCEKAAKHLNFGDLYVPSFSPTITFKQLQNK